MSENPALWHRAAQEHVEAAELIVDRYPLDAMYLAGYGPEFALKSLIWTLVPASAHANFVSAFFKGSRGHELETLKGILRALSRGRFLYRTLTEVQLRLHVQHLWEHVAELSEPGRLAKVEDEHLESLLTEDQSRELRAQEEAEMSVEEVEAFSAVSTWSPTSRYKFEAKTPDEAREFVRSARVIVDWAKRRLT